MKENYSLPLTKTEAKQLFRTMLLAEDTKKKLPKAFWKRHDVLIEKIQVIIYSANAKTDKVSQG